MTKLKQELKKRESKEFQQTGSKGIILGSIIATFIAITPYLYYLYESVPDQPVWNTFLFTYESKGWESAQIGLWVITGKLIPLLLILIWFFTCRHWWHHVLLIPITMYIYQLIIVINDDIPFMDEFQLIYLVPLMAIIIPSIYLIRARLFNRLNTVNQSIQDLEDELTFKPKTLWGKIKQYF